MPTPTRPDPLQLPTYPLYWLISPDYAAALRPPRPAPGAGDGAGAEAPDPDAGRPQLEPC